MSNIFDVTCADIERLSDIELTKVLIKLLYLEAQNNNIPANSVSGSLNITVADGGEDAHIRWTDGIERTDWLPNRYTLFQCKATNMPPGECKRELLSNSDGVPCLKAQVEQVLDAGGTYILFYYKGINAQQSTQRIDKFREALRDAGKTYADTADIQIYDANKIAAWANHFIAAELQICSMSGRGIPGGVMTWDQWEQYEDFLTPYEMSPALEGKINDLRNHYLGVKKVARIVGLSGLGKTRLALETFRPSANTNDNIEQQMRCAQALYLDANYVENIVSLVVQWRNCNLTGIIIVDNCDLRLHQTLEKEIKHGNSKLNLLTLDFSPEKDRGDYPYIELEPMPDKVIRGIIEQSYPGLPSADVDRIVQFSQGFPQIAVLLAKARIQDHYDIGNLQDDVLLEKLLWGRSDADTEKKEAISACSIFEYVGFDQELVDQRYFIADNICGMDRERFYRNITEFIKRGIIDKRHRYIRVVPQPLAVRLAADWWQNCSPERAIRFINEPMPDGMIEALCDQLAKLHFLPEAQRIIQELCSEQAPFGQAEVLNSEKGSRLFRSLVEVNPSATTQCVYKVFGKWSIEKLLTVKEGRRNLVWSLEKLCFWEDNFFVAAKIMLKFAVAENETWGNNATNQFLQLYQPLLSGTQTPPLDRLKVIEYALQQKEEQYKIVAINALGQGLRSSHFSRSSGVEKQGSRAPLSDWRPEVWGEIFDYWRECLKRLEFIATGDDEGLAKLAGQQIVSNLRSLVSYGLVDEIKEVVANIISNRGHYWPEAYEKMQEIITYEFSQLPAAGKVGVQEIIELLKPSGIKEILIQKVCLPPWNTYEEQDGIQVDITEREADDLAAQFVTNLEPIFENIDILLVGEQRKGFHFGRGLGLRIADPTPFINVCLGHIREIDKKSVNLSVLFGFFAGIQSRFPDVVTITLDNLMADQKLKYLIVDLTRALSPNRRDLGRVICCVGEDVTSLRSFAYGSILEDVPEEDIKWFCREISGQGASWISLDILYLHCFRNTDRIRQFKDILEENIFALNLQDSSVIKLLDVFHWEQVILQLVKIDDNTQIAKYIGQQLITVAASNELDRKLDTVAQHIMAQLLSDYQKVIWPILSRALLEIKVRSVFQDLIDLLRPHNYSEDVKTAILDVIAPELLIEWVKENPEKAPLVAALLFPVMIECDGIWDFHPIIKYILDDFGDSEAVIQQISSNMRTFSWTGSLRPLYERHIKVLTTLLKHPKEKVRDWSEQYIAYLESEILRKKRDEEEEEITYI